MKRNTLGRTMMCGSQVDVGRYMSNQTQVVTVGEVRFIIGLMEIPTCDFVSGKVKIC